MTTTTAPAPMLSPVEAKILAALDGSRPLYGKEIARKLCRCYDAELKVLLANLVNRGLLAHAYGHGYSRREA